MHPVSVDQGNRPASGGSKPRGGRANASAGAGDQHHATIRARI
jgi:hypothetical protein